MLYITLYYYIYYNIYNNINIIFCFSRQPRKSKIQTVQWYNGTLRCEKLLRFLFGIFENYVYLCALELSYSIN